ncbi:MAG: orotidine-5'-phosphate decarboxylase [Thiohalocapsa sp.]
MSDQLSRKNIPIDERLIVALDVPDLMLAKRLVAHLDDAAYFFKIGLELCMSGSYLELIEWLRRRGKRVICDLKFFDVPETVERAMRQLSDRGVDFVTVHGHHSMLETAASHKNRPKLLAVAAPNSLDRSEFESLGLKCDWGDLALAHARNALKLGCDGLFSSGFEAAGLRDDLEDRFLVAYPDLRLADHHPSETPTHPVTVEQAFRAGADYVVIGRQIKNAPDPRAKAEEIQTRIEDLFGAAGRAKKPHLT